MIQEFRDAAVGYARSWQTTMTVVVLLGLGVGASTATVSVMAAMLRNPIGLRSASDLVIIEGALLSLSGDLSPASPLLDYRDHLKTFADIAAYSDHEGGVNLGTAGETWRAQGAEVSTNFFGAIGAVPQKGRGFAPEEQDSGRNRVVVLSDGLWRTALGGSPGVVGRTITLNAISFTVIGVAPAGFRYPRDADFWIPISLGRDRIFTGPFIGYTVFGRLKSGYSITQARANLDMFVEAMKREAPHSWVTRRPMNMVLMSERLVAGVKLSLFILVLATSLVWVVACANASNLLLARTIARMKEIAIRTALGASPARIALHFLAEALLVSLLGALCGLLLAAVALHLILTYLPAEYPRIAIDNLLPWVFALDLGLSLVTGLVSVLPGVIQATTRRGEWLRSFGAGSATTRVETSRLARTLVVSQIAVAFVLITGAFSLARSLTALQHVDVGFRTSNLVAMSMSLPSARYPSVVTRRQFYDDLLQRTRALPQVVAADATNALPLGKADAIALLVSVIGHPSPKDFADRFALNVAVTPDYMRTVGVALLEGRYFTPDDTDRSAPVVIVNRTLARRYWSGKGAVGQRLEVAGASAPLQIVGVVGNVTQFSPRSKPEPQLYRPHTQSQSSLATVVVECRNDPEEVVPLVRGIVKSVDPEVALYGVTTLEQLVRGATGRERLLSYFMSIFAAIAIALAAVGVYAAMSRYVLQRRHEIGVRVAIGASRRNVLALILGQGLRLVGLGVAAGVALALVLMRTLTSALYGLGAADPLVYGGGAMLLLLIGVGACVTPARTASAVDPIVALRSE